jgi:hypothetical protein
VNRCTRLQQLQPQIASRGIQNAIYSPTRAMKKIELGAMNAIYGFLDSLHRQNNKPFEKPQ